MTNPETFFTTTQYHHRIREKVDFLKARLASPTYFDSVSERDSVFRYLINRAVEMGDAAFSIIDKQMPLSVLVRVLCEDVIKMYWVSISNANLTLYKEAVRAQSGKMLAMNITNKRIRVRETETGKDVTDATLSELEALSARVTVDRLASDCGLGRIYDTLYRYFSLTVHGNTFGIEPENDENGLAAIVSGINSLLGVMILILDQKPRVLSPEEILSKMYPSVSGG